MRCTWHPERDAIGICVVCRRTVCGDCATDVDGIQRCEDCLAQVAALERAPDRPAWRDRWTAGRALSTIAGWAALTGVIWGVFEVIRSVG